MTTKSMYLFTEGTGSMLPYDCRMHKMFLGINSWSTVGVEAYAPSNINALCITSEAQ